MPTRRLIAAVLCWGVLVCCCPGQVGAHDIKDWYGKIERGILPPWSQYVQTMDYDSPTGKKYQEKFGPIWHHMHHYAYGLDEMYESFQNISDPQVRKGLLKEAIADFDYVLDRADSGFVMLPEILTKKGLALMFLDRHVEAVASLKKAIALKSDYVPAYVALSDCFILAGDRENGMQMIRDGLKQSPSSPALKSKLQELQAAQPK
jgi:tetratricopeptide (TPR) repeat protein